MTLRRARPRARARAIPKAKAKATETATETATGARHWLAWRARVLANFAALLIDQREGDDRRESGIDAQLANDWPSSVPFQRASSIRAPSGKPSGKTRKNQRIRKFIIYYYHRRALSLIFPSSSAHFHLLAIQIQ